MSLFFPKGQKVKPQYTGLQTQTSASTLPIPLVWGKTRIAPNIIWSGDFKATKQKQKAGKGGGSQEFYTYSVSLQMGLCWGEISDVFRAWKDQDKETSYSALGMTLFKGVVNQSPWGYLLTNHPSEALGYQYIAHLDVANYDLGQQNSLSQHSFEVGGLRYNSQVNGAGDADPALIIDDFLTDPLFGMITDSNVFVDEDTLFSTPDATTTGDNTFQTYCRAMGFGMSPMLVSQEDGKEILERWTMLCNTALVWTGYSLKFIPYAGEEVVGNGVIFAPDTVLKFAFTDDDYRYAEDQDPITFDRMDPTEAKNSFKLEIKNRANEYNNLPIEWVDQALIDQFGSKPADTINAEDVCETSIGEVMAALIGQRKAYLRNTYNLTVGPEWSLLEPMDIGTAYDPRWGTMELQIESIDEDDEGNLNLVLKEYIGTLTTPGPTSNAAISNNPINTGVTASDVNPPIIFQPPPTLTGGQPQVWAAVSGGDGTDDDPLWGGAEVWISTDGGTSYNMVGIIDAPARMGVLTAGLPAYGGSNPDTVNTLAISSAMSDAEFTTATAADALAGVTLTYIEPDGANDAEYLSYQTATLTGADAYDLTNLYRAFHGTSAGAHGAGAKFARLDNEAIFKYNFPLSLIGETVFVKFRSFNIWSNGYQDLADCTAYDFTIESGYTYGTGINDLNDVDLSGIADGDTLVYDSGTGTWVVHSLAGDEDLRFYGSLEGKPTAGQELFNIEMLGDEVFDENLPENNGGCTVAPTGAIACAIRKNGVGVGSMNIAAGATVATWTLSADLTFTDGDNFAFVAPATQDATLSGLFYTFKGRRIAP